MTTSRVFAYDAQLAAMPSVVAELLAQPIAAVLDQVQPIIFSGVGASLHAAKIAADWVCRATGGRVRAFAYDAHDLGTGAVPLLAGDQVVVISHRGSKIFPNASLAHARRLGC